MSLRRSKEQGRRLPDILPILAFALACLFFAFASGVAVMKYKVFPYEFITNAFEALHALKAVESDKTSPIFLRYLQPGETERITKAADLRNEQDLIVMSGSFYFRSDVCPKFGCIAWIMSRSGKVLHSWSYDPAKLFNPADFKAADFKGLSGFPSVSSFFVVGSDLDAEGNLIATFQPRNVFPYGFAMAKFSPDGRLLWKRVDLNHHWPTVGPDGKIYSPAIRVLSLGDHVQGLPAKPSCWRGALYFDEAVRVYSPSGQLLHEFWMSKIARQSDRLALGFTVRNDCDPWHLNGIDLVNQPMADKLKASGVADARPGDLIVSLRSASALLFMDADTGRIKHISYGPMVQQHSPATLPDGNLLVFDNLGASNGKDKRSRILEIGFHPESYVQRFPRRGGDDPHIFTGEQGAVNVSGDGKRALVAETEGGRVFEVDLATGAVLWGYREADDTGAYLAAKGDSAKGRPALHETHGASYITKADYQRIFGGR